MTAQVTKGAKRCVRPDGAVMHAPGADCRQCGRPAVSRPSGARRLSRAPRHRDRPVRARRADRHHRADSRRCRCRSGSASNSLSTTAAGASGNIGMGQVARATPDGYTLMVTSTAIAVNRRCSRTCPTIRFKDFAPISELVNAPNVLFVRSNSDIRTIADLVAQREGQAEQVQLFAARASAPSRTSPPSCSSCAPASTWCRALSRRRSRRAGGDGGHGPDRIGGAGRRRSR